MLAQQIKSNLYTRAGKVISNFEQTLPAPQSDLVQQTLKDPYTFDFLSMTVPYNEREIERKLVQHMTKFLMELGIALSNAHGWEIASRTLGVFIANIDCFKKINMAELEIFCQINLLLYL